MKIAFFSNYLNHHQHALCEAFNDQLNGNFRFVACTPFNISRKSLGYRDMNHESYVIRAYEGGEQLYEARKWCMESDVIIHGSAPEIFAVKRIENGLPTFKYSERILKKGIIHAFSPRARKKIYERHTKYVKNPLYMLCASAYTAMDFYRFGAYKNKTYKWGYFPQTNFYDNIESFIQKKGPTDI